MGNEINELDKFIRQEMEGFKASPPQGVFEGIDQAINSGAGSSSAQSLLGKGIGKIILGIASAGIIGSGVYLWKSGVLGEAGSGKREAGRAKMEVGSEKQEGIRNEELGIRNREQGDVKQPESSLKKEQDILYHGALSPLSNHHSNGMWQFDDNEKRQTDPNNQTSNPTNGNNDSQAKPNSPIDNHGKKIELTIEGPSELCPGQEGTFKVTCNKKTDALLASFANEDLQLHVKDMKFSHKFAKAGKTYVIVDAFVGGEMFHFSKEMNVQPLQTSFEVDYRNYPELRFVAKDNAEQYLWNFGNNDQIVSENETRHRFELPTEGDSQLLEVRLEAKNTVGCQATFAQPLTLYQLNEPIIPNVFTPNGDGLNDRFEIYINNPATFHLSISDRMGMKVFESYSQENTWDGSIDGRTISGTYYYQFEYRQKGIAMPKTVQGNLTILKQN